MAASYLSESFEATKPTNGGYDNAGWSETVGSGCTIDPDNADVARPTGGGNQVLKMVNTGNGVANTTYKSLGTDKVITYTTAYLMLSAMSDGESCQPMKTSG